MKENVKTVYKNEWNQRKKNEKKETEKRNEWKKRKLKENWRKKIISHDNVYTHFIN